MGDTDLGRDFRTKSSEISSIRDVEHLLNHPKFVEDIDCVGPSGKTALYFCFASLCNILENHDKNPVALTIIQAKLLLIVHLLNSNSDASLIWTHLTKNKDYTSIHAEYKRLKEEIITENTMQNDFDLELDCKPITRDKIKSIITGWKSKSQYIFYTWYTIEKILLINTYNQELSKQVSFTKLFNLEPAILLFDIHNDNGVSAFLTKNLHFLKQEQYNSICVEEPYNFILPRLLSRLKDIKAKDLVSEKILQERILRLELYTYNFEKVVFADPAKTGLPGSSTLNLDIVVGKMLDWDHTILMPLRNRGIVLKLVIEIDKCKGKTMAQFGYGHCICICKELAKYCVNFIPIMPWIDEMLYVKLVTAGDEERWVLDSDLREGSLPVEKGSIFDNIQQSVPNILLKKADAPDVVELLTTRIIEQKKSILIRKEALHDFKTKPLICF